MRGNLRHFEGLQSYICTRGLLGRVNSRSTYMYLHGFCDAGTRPLLKFRSAIHGMNEELSRHRGRKCKAECSICGAECKCSLCVVGASSILSLGVG